LLWTCPISHSHAQHLLFFFSMRRPPCSTLFPYTTLFRSVLQFGSWADPEGRVRDEILCVRFEAPHSFTGEDVVELHAHGGAFHRSEEHTSELQSRENLVCRLLLEKKKKCTQGCVYLSCPT